jgi:phytoene dehydrogenase-like protein
MKLNLIATIFVETGMLLATVPVDTTAFILPEVKTRSRLLHPLSSLRTSVTAEIEQDHYDAIVIGAGMSGLVAGTVLAKQGRRVLMLEKQPIPGGVTTNFRRKDYRFEVSTHMMIGCETGDTADLFKEIDVIPGKDIQFAELDTFFHFKNATCDGEDFQLWVDLTKHIETLVKSFPDQEAGIREFYQKYLPVYELMTGLEHREGIQCLLFILQNLSALPTLFRLHGKTIADILDPLISDPSCRFIMSIFGGFLGLHYAENDALLVIMAIFGMHREKPYYPIGGSGRLSKTIATKFQEYHGDLRLNTLVDSIIFKNGKAMGVRAITGKNAEFEAYSDCIISASDLSSIVSNLSPPGVWPRHYVENIVSRTPGPSLVVAWVGLNVDLKQQGIKDYELLWLANPAQSREEFDALVSSADYSDLPAYGATIYSNIDPTCCPPGKSVVVTLFPASYEAFERTLGPDGKRGKAYRSLKNQTKDQLVSTIAKALDIPNIADHIEVIEVGTPVTINRYTGHRGGAFIGWRLSARQGIFSLLPLQTPINNVFACGQWAGKGIGVSGVMKTGREAGKMAESYLKRKGVARSWIGNENGDQSLVEKMATTRERE